MANFSIICALLAACCVFTLVDHTMSAPTPLKIKFLHDHTGRLVRGQPSQGPVTAAGVSKGQSHYECMQYIDNIPLYCHLHAQLCAIS